MSSTHTIESRQMIWPYIQIARIDHWFKNAFMLLGVVLAVFYEPGLFAWSSVPMLALAVFATCLVASSNYVINELLDGPYDRKHPVKRFRPVPSGHVQYSLAIAEWLFLAIAGISLAMTINVYFAASALVFWLAGVAYNVPPVRTKELPYLDVLSESLNNPIRLFLGWFALLPDMVPPLSLTLAYWMVGAFFMATKRFAEFRRIRDREVLIQYRRSFRHYTEERLLLSMFFYGLTCALFTGVFLVRYHAELILFVPVAASFLTYYFKLGLLENSPVQNPEKLCRDRTFMLFGVFCVLLFVLLMFVRLPVMYEIFNIDESLVSPLWTIGGK